MQIAQQVGQHAQMQINVQHVNLKFETLKLLLQETFFFFYNQCIAFMHTLG